MNTPPIIPSGDLWLRQVNAQCFAFEFAPLGIPARITANHAGVLSAAKLSAGRHSQASPDIALPASAGMLIQIVVRPGETQPPPDDFAKRLIYTGVGEWITVSAGEWGYGFANLSSRSACVVLSPTLAADARLVSRYFIDHYVLNFALTEWAMLHASCVLDPAGQQLIVLVAPHNTGKSTAALRLTQAGYIFLADGMALLRGQAGRFVVAGYPLGEVKLRDDVLALFPDYAGEAVQVREQRKTVVNLRATYPDRLAEAVFTPRSIHVCFVEREATSHTRLTPLAPAEALPHFAANTAEWAEPVQLQHNTETLHQLLQAAHFYRLHLGPDRDNLAAVLHTGLTD